MTPHQRSGDKSKEKTYSRLPKCITPTHYTLSFQPDEQNPVLDGEMSVRIQVMCETKEIVMNGLNITISKAEFTEEATCKKAVAKYIDADNNAETIRIEFEEDLKPGFGLLNLEFEAEITENMRGLYRTEVSGSDEKSQLRYNYITHFEPVAARRCFPSWDEPAFKATFDITLIVPKDVVAISNMPLKEQKTHSKNEKLKVCTFETTPKMSTYLIAFVIGEFDYVEKKNEEGVLVRVFTPPGKKDQGNFSLELAAKALTYYKEYFGIPYPLPKIDLVASREFPIGAMENYGLVTFKDSRLLVDPLETSALNKQWTAVVVAHELSHMWFGNLVTMKWWTDLWLKEGFANFIESLCVNEFFPEFDIWSQFTTNNLIPALETDALKSSHPVEVQVTNPSEIDEIFDSISYEKGSSIIRMMYNFIGDELFRKGMNIYLNRFQYSNAETLDLWDALSEASGRPVQKMMATFTKQTGFPLLTVLNVECDQNAQTRTFTVKQERFWADSKFYGEEYVDLHSSYKWVIPVTFVKGSKPGSAAYETLFDGNESSTTKIVVPDVGANEWVKINAGMNGFYRVSYPANLLQEFLPAIQDLSMAPMDRLGLLDDLYASVKSGRNTASDILNLSTAFQNETNYTIWTTIRDIMAGFHNLVLRTELIDKFREYGVLVFKPLKERLGWEPKPSEEHTTGMLRGVGLSRLIEYGDPQTIHEAKQLFEQHINGEKMIPADLRTLVYRAVLSEGNEETLELMLNMFRESELSEEKSRILQSLGAVKNKLLMKKILDFSISKDVKTNETITVLFSFTSSKEGQDMIWKFFKDNIKLFQERYPGGGLICRAVTLVTEHFISEEYAVEVEEFFQNNPCRGTERTVQQVVENIRINATWLKRDFNSIADFLNSPQPRLVCAGVTVPLSDGKTTFHRLAKSVIPINYDIYVEPDWANSRGYFCKTKVTVNVVEPSTSEVLLNSVGASIKAVTFETLGSGKLLYPKNIDQRQEDKKAEILRFEFLEALELGIGVLSIEFFTEYCDVAGLGMKGFYRSKSKGSNGSDDFSYLTFFAPTYARNAFPCWDEPNFKATFDISLLVPTNLVAVSNMPEVAEKRMITNESPSSLVLKRFEQTPKMSTYLAVWMMGEFDCLEDVSQEGVRCRVFTPIGKQEQGRFAINVAIRSLSYYNEYFRLPYPLPKLDLAAVGDFPCGGMENWGLVTFRETSLLVDEKNSSFVNRRRIGLTCSHEVAHSWFGNLVTMEWWTDLWLNEGFASFVEFLCIDSLFPEWNVWTQFASDVMIPALQLDSLSSSHPIEVIVKNPSDIDEIFDVISYKKGSSVIRMLYNWMGGDDFRTGMQSYLKKYQYSNAQTSDLWKELEQASGGKPVGQVMATWTKQKGYPLIEVTDVVRDGKEVTITLTGKLFLLEASSASEAQTYEYRVPLTIYKLDSKGSNSSVESLILHVVPEFKTRHTMQLDENTYFKLNNEGVGFYRVLYLDEKLLQDLMLAVEHKLLPALDRLNLIDDLFAAVVSGNAQTRKLLNFLKAYEKEDEYSVWCVISRIFDNLIQILSDSEKQLSEVKAFGRSLYKYVADRLSWNTKETDKPLDALLRPLAIRKMIEFGELNFITEGKQRFELYVQGKAEIPADMKSAVYKAAIHGEDKVAVDKLLELFRKTDLLEEKLRILSVMDAVKHPETLTFLLNFALSNEVRSQDAVSVVEAVSNSGSYGRNLAWDFFKQNKDHFKKQFTGLFIIGRLVTGISQNFSTKVMENEIKTFFAENSFRGTDMTVQQSLERIRIHQAWLERLDEERKEWEIPLNL